MPPEQGTDSFVGAALEVAGVSVRYGGIAALTDVSFSAQAGEILGLIGPNGAGKTTLFDAVSGVRSPSAGTIILEGDDVTRTSAITRSRRGLRRTFQRVQTFGWLSVEDNVLAALEWRSGGGGFLADLVSFPTRLQRERARRDRARDVIERCGLTAVAKEPAGSLPIGLARMVELARAVVDSPKVLLLDEPTSGLDDMEVERLATLVESITTAERCAVLLVEHDMGFVMRECHRIVVLDLGRVLATGNPREIQENPDVRAAYLGAASTRDGA